MTSGITAALVSVLMGTTVVHPVDPATAVRQTKTPIRDAIAHVSLTPSRTAGQTSPIPAPHSSRVPGALLGAVGGLYAGAGIGYLLTKDCRCDDPGMGALIGFPIGAVVGGILGYKFLR
jgi:hypothetical protein